MIAMDRSQLLRDIQLGTAKFGLRPTKTVDKSRPVVLAEGEQLKTFRYQPAPSIPPPPPPPPPSSKASIPKSDSGSKVYNGVTKRGSATADRDALLSDIRQGITLRKVSKEDIGSGGSAPADPVQYAPPPPPPPPPPPVPRFFISECNEEPANMAVNPITNQESKDLMDMLSQGTTILRKARSDNSLGSFDAELATVVAMKQKEKEDMFARVAPPRRSPEDVQDGDPKPDPRLQTRPSISMAGQQPGAQGALLAELASSFAIRKSKSETELNKIETKSELPKEKVDVAETVVDSKPIDKLEQSIGHNEDLENLKPPLYPPPPPPVLDEAPPLSGGMQKGPSPELNGYVQVEDRVSSRGYDVTDSRAHNGLSDRREPAPSAMGPSPIRNWQLASDSSQSYNFRSTDSHPTRTSDLARRSKAPPNFGALRQHFETSSQSQSDHRRPSLNSPTSPSPAAPTRAPFPQTRKFFAPSVEEKKAAVSHLGAVLRRRIDDDLAAERSATPDSGTARNAKMDFGGRNDDAKVVQLMSMPVDDLKNFHFKIDLNDEGGDFLRIQKRYNE